MKTLVHIFLAITVLCFACSSQAMMVKKKPLEILRAKNAVIKDINDRYNLAWKCPISEEDLKEAFDNHPIINILFNGNLQDLTAALHKATFSVDKNNRNILHFLMCISDPWKKAKVVMSYVKKNRININAQDKNGRTPFHYAILYANITGVITLQKVQACLWIKDSIRKTAVDYFADCLIHNEGHFKTLLNSLHKYVRTTKPARYKVKHDTKPNAGAIGLLFMSIWSLGASL